MIDFPDNPQIGQVFSAVNNTYTWDGVKWRAHTKESGGPSEGSLDAWAGDVVVSVQNKLEDGRNLLPCDGSLVDESRYPDLANITENIPNYSATGLDYKVVAENPGTPPFVPPAWETSIELPRIEDPDLGAWPSIQLGNSVAFSKDGSNMFVGTPSAKQYVSGVVYWYELVNGTYQLKQEIAQSPSVNYARFGRAVAVSADLQTLVISSPGDSSPVYLEGTVQIFTRSGETYTQVQTIEEPTLPKNSNYFGNRLEMSDDASTLVIASKRNDTDGTDKGLVYVYINNAGTYELQETLQPAEVAASDEFGYDVDISGDGNTIIVGCYYQADNPRGQGKIYIFHKSGNSWILATTVTGNWSSFSAQYSREMAINYDGTVIVSGHGYTNLACPVFTRNGDTWAWAQDIISDLDVATRSANGRGPSISDDGNTICIGDPSDSTAGGAISVYERNDAGVWNAHAPIVASDGVSGFSLGYHTFMSGDGRTIAAWARTANIPSTSSGLVYVFKAGD